MDEIETVLENLEDMLLEDNLVEAYEYACENDLSLRRHPRGYEIVGTGIRQVVEL